LDSEKDIKKAIKRLVIDNGWDKAHTLSFLHNKYQSENCIEEAAAIVAKLIDKQVSEAQFKYDES
jgi:hypothetical protein